MRFKKMLKEANEMDFNNAMQNLANLVGKDGKYSHSGFSQFLAKEYGFKPSEADVKKTLDALEDWNYHNEYAIFQEILRGNKKNADVLLDIAKAHHKIGHMPADLITLRHYIGKGMKGFAKYWEDIGKSTYGGMKLSPETIKIAKKLPKKDADYFLGLFGA